MTASSVTTAPSADSSSPQTSSPYKYDLRLEIGVKKDGETVPVVAIFNDLVRRFKEAADDDAPVVILTATDKLFYEHQEMTSEDFQKAFKVDNTEGKNSKVMLGFKMHSLTKLSDLKRRMMHTHLIPNNLFIRQHVGGFQNGIKTYSYGFLKDDHPDHPDLSTLNQRFARIVADSWKKLEKDDKTKWRKEVPQAFYDNAGPSLPVVFTKERISANDKEKGKITTYALMVSIATKYGRFLKALLDVALTTKRLNNLIPFALGRDNPEGYYYMVAHQARFIDNHRNIPIMNVPSQHKNDKSSKGETLIQVLHGNPAVQRVSYDGQQSKYHVSTTAAKYREVHLWINGVLKEHNFSYEPSLRTMKYDKASGNGTMTSYSEIFRDAISVASNSYAASTIKTTPSNVWKNRPPLAISYNRTDDAFPALKPVKPTVPATPSTASETLFEDETIQSSISTAIKKLEEQHRAELNKLQQEMQIKIDEVKSQMKELGQQVATQTYQALVQEESPLVTKLDHAHLQKEMSIITTQLTTIISLFHRGNTCALVPDTGVAPQSPARVPKRPKPTMTPEKLWNDDPLTQETSVSSATSSPDEGMEGCEE